MDRRAVRAREGIARRALGRLIAKDERERLRVCVAREVRYEQARKTLAARSAE